MNQEFITHNLYNADAFFHQEKLINERSIFYFKWLRSLYKLCFIALAFVLPDFAWEFELNPILSSSFSGWGVQDFSPSFIT